MPTVSASDVQDLTGTSLSTTLIEAQIAFVISRAGDCLDSSYSASEANLIALYAASALADLADSTRKIKTEKAANGASTTYQDLTLSQSMFNENQYGAQALMFDTNGCLISLFPRLTGVRTSGQDASPC